eukprot:4739609-Alexandrium_andersonii.AAC.1
MEALRRPSPSTMLQCVRSGPGVPGRPTMRKGLSWRCKISWARPTRVARGWSGRWSARPSVAP